MKKQLKLSLNSGITFGIITIFLFLVGFTGTVADILAVLFKNKTAAVFLGLTPQMQNMLLFLGLIGLWAGASGSRKVKSRSDDPWGIALLGGTFTGLVHGLLVCALVLIVGTLNQRGVRMSVYLAEVLPAAVKLFLLGQTPQAAGLFYLGFMLVTGFLGSLLSRGIGRGSWRNSSAASWKKTWASFNQQSFIKQMRGNPITRYVIYGILLVLVFLIPLGAGQYWNYTIGTVGIYVLLGLGLNIVVGLAGLLDLGYVAFFAIGAYTMALMTAPAPQHLLWNFWIVLPVGIVLAAITGLLLGAPVLRMRGDYLAIVTLGFGEIIRILSKSDDLTTFTGGPKGVSAIGGPSLFGKPFNSAIDYVYLIFLAVLLVIFVTNRLQNSRVGRAWEAMREDETVSRAMGINTLTQKLLAFAIGAAFAGLGGAIFASRNQFTGPDDFSLMVSINVVAVVIVGGMGNIPGVIAGALVLKGLPEVLRQLQDYRVLVFGALLVVMMLWRPAGILPSSRRKMESNKDIGVTDTPKEGREGMTVALETRALTKQFGGLTAVNSVDLIIPEGSIFSVIGPNGAGKTTFYNCITGFYEPESGDVLFYGKSLVGLAPDQVTYQGISRTYQNIRLFANMSAIENILVGQHSRMRANWADAILHTPRMLKEEKAAVDKACELLEFVGLVGLGDQLARNLPYGAQRRLEIARALGSQPRLLLLDEPTAGMNPHESVDMMHFIRRLRDELGITILLIEHDMRVVMGISEQIAVLDYGAKIAEGTPAQIQGNPRVIEAYLGSGAASGLNNTAEKPA